MKNLFVKTRNLLVRFEEGICGVLLVAMTGVISYGMFERFVIQQGVGWTDELSRYLSIWAIFFGASLGIVRGAHVGVEVFVRLFPLAVQHVMERVAMFVCTVFTGTLSWAALKYFFKLMDSGQITPAMQVPLCWVFFAVPIGCMFMCLHFFIRLVLAGEENQNG